MWIDRAAQILLVLSLLSLLYMGADILAWPYGVAWFNPLLALYGILVWLAPFTCSFFWLSHLSDKFKALWPKEVKA